MLLHVLKLIVFQSIFHYLIIGFFTLRLFVLEWLSKQTAIVVSLEALVRNWVDESMLFKDEYNNKPIAILILPFCHESH